MANYLFNNLPTNHFCHDDAGVVLCNEKTSVLTVNGLLSVKPCIALEKISFAEMIVTTEEENRIR